MIDHDELRINTNAKLASKYDVLYLDRKYLIDIIALLDELAAANHMICELQNRYGVTTQYLPINCKITVKLRHD